MLHNLSKIATVLEAAADHLDAIEHEKQSSVMAERQSRVDDLANKYAETTGDEMPAEIRAKLATSDKAVVELLDQMVQKHASRIAPLGGPSSDNDDSAPLTKKEAADAASDRFINWITK